MNEHQGQFANSEDNRRLKRLLGSEVSIDRYFHLDLDQSRVDIGGALDGRSVAVLRHFVTPGCRMDVERVGSDAGGPPNQFWRTAQSCGRE